MNEELVMQAGQKVSDYLEATEGFVVVQAPLLAQEIIAWGVWSHGSLAAVFLLIMLAALACSWFTYVLTDKDKGYVPVTFLFWVIVLLCFVGILIQAFLTLKICIAPRLYILEQIGGLF